MNEWWWWSCLKPPAAAPAPRAFFLGDLEDRWICISWPPRNATFVTFVGCWLPPILIGEVNLCLLQGEPLVNVCCAQRDWHMVHMVCWWVAL